MSEFYFYTTPLHHAVRNNDFEQVVYLINQGADINEKDDDDTTPFELAKIIANKEIITFMETTSKIKNLS